MANFLPADGRGEQGAGDGLRHGVGEGEPAFDGEAADCRSQEDALPPPVAVGVAGRVGVVCVCRLDLPMHGRSFPYA